MIRLLIAAALALLLSACGLPGYTRFAPEAGHTSEGRDTATYDEALGDREIRYEAAIVDISPSVVGIQNSLLQKSLEVSPAAEAEIATADPLPADYRIGVGDIIHVVVYGHPELTTPGRALAEEETSEDVSTAIDPISIDIGSFAGGDLGIEGVENLTGGATQGEWSGRSAPVNINAANLESLASGSGASERNRSATDADLSRYLGNTQPSQSEQARGSGGASQTALGQLVDSSGDIYYPYVGTVHAAGLTRQQLRRKIVSGLSGYIRQPEVDIRILEYRSQQVLIYGDIPKPCVVPFTDIGMTVIEALEQCGGFGATNASIPRDIPERARAMREKSDRQRGRSRAAKWNGPNLSSIVLIRDGESQTLDLFELYKQGKSVPLEAGDRILVDDSGSRVYMVGEFRRQLAIPHGVGRLALVDAMAAAGGVVSETGQGADVYVFRRLFASVESDEEALVLKPLVYRLQTEVPQSLLLASQFYLRPDDVVYAAPARAANFDRALTLLTPSLDQLFTSFLFYDRLR